MNSGKTWGIYDCDLIDVGELYPRPDSSALPKALAIHFERPPREAEGLPKGFSTKVLLDYDFSDDEQVLEFTRQYGLVTCPYAGAIDRTSMAIEETFGYRRLLNSIVREREASKAAEDAEDAHSAGLWARLHGLLRDWHRRGDDRDTAAADPSEDFKGCDYMWDAKRVFYSGLTSSKESDYLRSNMRGFVRYLESDDKLVGTERLRAFAWNEEARRHEESGEWVLPLCLISLEEVRAVLYLLQVSSVVLQGFSYIDHTLSERQAAGRVRRKYASQFLLPSTEGVDDEVVRKNIYGANRAAATYQGVRRTERLFQLFIMGRPNIVKALRSVRGDCLGVFREGDRERLAPGVISDALDESERQRVDRILDEAKESSKDDPETLRLLDLRPIWGAWEDPRQNLEGDLAIFLEACLTNGWVPRNHRLIEDESLMVGDLGDGGPCFEDRANRMTLQKAIAEQIRHQLDVANQSLSPNQRANASKEPAWHVCSECGRLFMFRSTTDRLVMEGEGKPDRDRIPSAETCSNMCRQRKSRAGR